MTKKKLVGIIAGCITFIIVAVAVGTPTPTPATFTLSTSVSPTEAGSVSPSIGEYNEDDQVNVIATPSVGYVFSHWSGDASGASLTVVLTMDSDKTLVAHFTDIALPVILDVRVTNVTDSGATITWMTNDAATSQVEYGTTSGYGLKTPHDENLVTGHSMTLDELEPNTTYHFRTRSQDAAGNEGMSEDYAFTTARTATEVGGILSANTRWTKANSPYEIVETVQIREGVTLTIEPGVTVTMLGSGDMFLLHGRLIAHGTATSKITFDGGDNSNFFNAKGSKDSTLLSLEYCVIENGISFWPPSGHEQYGSLILRYSEVINLTGYSYIWYPGQSVYIEYNRFKNAGGFSVGHDGNVKVYIRYNLFDGKNPELPSYADFWVQNWAAYDSSITIVKYNSFINNVGIVLELYGGYDKAGMIAAENYWGTQDTHIIDQFIYDKNDDITCADYIEYLPVLGAPHPNTPRPE